MYRVIAFNVSATCYGVAVVASTPASCYLKSCLRSSQAQTAMRFFRQVSAQLARLSAGSLWGLAAVLVGCVLVVNNLAMPALRKATGDPNFQHSDSYLVRQPSATFDNLDALGPSGVTVYLWVEAIDILIPASYSLLFGGLLAKIFQVAPQQRAQGELASLVLLLDLLWARCSLLSQTQYTSMRFRRHDRLLGSFLPYELDFTPVQW